MNPLQLMPEQIVREATTDELNIRLTAAELSAARARGGTILIAPDGRLVIDPGHGRPEEPVAPISPRAAAAGRTFKGGRRAKVDLRA